MSRPKIHPELVATITSVVPRRLIAKLDAQPTIAEKWAWTHSEIDAQSAKWVIKVDSGEVITLQTAAGVIRLAEHIQCSCLLSPKCFHILAAVTVLEPDNQSEPEPVSVASDAKPQLAFLSTEQVLAAQMLWKTAAQVLAVGGNGVGAVLQAELLRTVHTCRSVGLHRLAAAGIRVVQGIRNLRSDRPEFNLSGLGKDLYELLKISWELGGRSETPDSRAATPEQIGTARRAYSDAGNLKLSGVWTEPILTRTGYAGVVTYLVDRHQTMYSLASIALGDETSSPQVYNASAGLGDLAVQHRDLSRVGVFIEGATISPEGRLGTSATIRAVKAGSQSWGDPTVRALWDVPLRLQLERAFHTTLSTSREAAAVGSDTLFFQGKLIGADKDALFISVIEPADPHPLVVRGVMASDHSALVFRDNLKLLAQSVGLTACFIGRFLPEQPKTVALLAAGNFENQPPGPVDLSPETPAGFRFPTAWMAHCNLGLDRLQGSYLPPPDDAAVVMAGLFGQNFQMKDENPLLQLQRRLERMVLGGKATLTPEMLTTIDRETALLERRLLPTAAILLHNLAQTVCSTGRTISGGHRTVSPTALAEAWIAAMTYTQSALNAWYRGLWER
ncbi:MAG TPA: hypothetical protein PL157_08770 [Acidobacteriota bacterium]|nr:hypothetical protein [Acidobacteriota bacterium]